MAIRKSVKHVTSQLATHIVCTNHGSAFTKGNQDPSDSKFAMIDRSISHAVRGTSNEAHTDSEFERGLQQAHSLRMLSMFRLLVSMTGVVHMIIKGIPSLQPDFALANLVFDHLDKEMIVGQYNLPNRSPRKTLRRENNLLTMCIMESITAKFWFKQSAIEFDDERPDRNGDAQPFSWIKLYDVIARLQPSIEVSMMAWSQGLDYSIGTSAMSSIAMTALCESLDIHIGDWLKLPPDMQPKPVKPVPDDFSDAVQFNQAMEAYSALDVKTELALGITEGFSIEERTRMMTRMSRSRQATTEYRKQAKDKCDKQSAMGEMIPEIERIMKDVTLPLDLDEEETVQSADGTSTYMPLYSSLIMADVVQCSITYNPTSIFGWAVRNEIVKNGTYTNTELGCRGSLAFSMYGNGEGPCKWDTSKLELKKNGCHTWFSYAKHLHSNNTTVRVFDLHESGLRDTLYMLSTSDNARRLTEKPKMMKGYNSKDAFAASSNDDCAQATGLKMQENHSENPSFTPGQVEKPRHPYSLVDDTRTQRSSDKALCHSRLPAMQSILSNQVIIAPPIKMVFSSHRSSEGKRESGEQALEVNTAAAFDHTRMMAEAVIRCSLQPGMDRQEDADVTAHHPGLHDKIGKDNHEKRFDQKIQTLPFTYDTLTIALTLDAMDRFYDDYGVDHCILYRESYGDLVGFDIKFDELPHICTRFLGTGDADKLLSIKMPSEKKAKYPIVEGTARSDETTVCATVISIQLGHDATDEEIEQYKVASQGSRSMTIQGDIFATSTWVRHTCASLETRGMSYGLDDPLIAVIRDSMYGLQGRVSDYASTAINQLVDKQIAKTETRGLCKEEMKRVTFNLYEDITLPNSGWEHLRKYASTQILKKERNKMTYINNSPGEEKKKTGKTNKRKNPCSSVNNYTQAKYNSSVFNKSARTPANMHK